MTHTDIMNIIKDSYTGIVYNQSKPAVEFLSTLLQDLHFEDFSCAKSPFFRLLREFSCYLEPFMETIRTEPMSDNQNCPLTATWD